MLAALLIIPLLGLTKPSLASIIENPPATTVSAVNNRANPVPSVSFVQIGLTGETTTDIWVTRLADEAAVLPGTSKRAVCHL